MSRGPATFLRHLLSILALPFTVAVVIPFLLLRQGGGGATSPVRAGGIVLLVIGLALVVATIRDFATRGQGTLAPWDPPHRLVVRGIYRYVRNPMITGVVLMLLGESMLFGSIRVAMWAAIVFGINAVYVPAVEEKGLVRRFGAEYDEYCRNVPRWIPRRTPWHPPDSG